MNRTTGKRALMVAWVLLLSLASASGVLAELITYDFRSKVAGSSVENASYASLAASGAWVEVGSGSASGGGISNSKWSVSVVPSVALDPSGNPYVAWMDGSRKFDWYHIYIKRFDGANWVEVGSGSATGAGISDLHGWSTCPSLALDGSGNPYVAWHVYTSGNAEIYIKRFDGAKWVEVGSGSASGGGISDDSGLSRHPSLALDASGNPYVAWSDRFCGNSDIYIKRFNRTSWVEVGSGSASAGGISDTIGDSVEPSLALDGSGNPYVAWYDGPSTTNANTEIYIKRFDGTSWVEVGSGSASGGGISDNSGRSGSPSLALNWSGNPYVAWGDSSRKEEYSEIYIKQYSELTNGSFEKDGRIPAPWKGIRLTARDGRVCNAAHNGRCSFRMVGTRAKKSLRQVVRISGSAGDSCTLKGWSRGRKPPRKGGAYCLQAKIFYTDGTKENYRTCFTKPTHGWQYRSKTFTTAKDYEKIVVFLLYYKQSGRAWFDDVQLVVRH